jgi:hypothetical protein
MNNSQPAICIITENALKRDMCKATSLNNGNNKGIGNYPVCIDELPVYGFAFTVVLYNTGFVI